MKRLALALALLLPATLLVAATATSQAAPRTAPSGSLSKYLYRVYGTIGVPVEYAGIWTTTDTTYDCDRNFQSTDTYTDTLCTGMIVYEPPPEKVDIECTGTTDADEIHLVCAGFFDADPCSINYVFTIDGTRSGETLVSESRFEIITTGPANPCDFFPDNCSIVRTHATRTAPEPVAYCATPAVPATWGSVKGRYR